MPPAPLFVVGALSQYLGAAVAVGLFDNLAAASVAWLRVLFGGVVVAAVLGVSPSRIEPAQRWPVVGLGLSMALMNLSFYLAIDRLPLGTAVAVEFLGPVGVAAFFSRSRRSALALISAVTGVALVADVHLRASAGGLAAALFAATGWAGYIVFAKSVASRGPGLGGLLGAFVVATMALTPIGLLDAGALIDRPTLIALAALVGLLSSAVPYWIDQVVLRRLLADTFALLQSILPVVAALIGAALLSQRLEAFEWLGIALVIIALALRPPVPVDPANSVDPAQPADHQELPDRRV